MTPALLRAYRSARYVSGDITLRIGRRTPALDSLLRRHRAPAGVFVTAWNPRSRRQPIGWNRRMQAALGQQLRRWPIQGGHSGCGRWREAQYLVLADPRPLRRLARRFRQNAIVEARRGMPACLGICR